MIRAISRLLRDSGLYPHSPKFGTEQVNGAGDNEIILLVDHRFKINECKRESVVVSTLDYRSGGPHSVFHQEL